MVSFSSNSAINGIHEVIFKHMKFSYSLFYNMPFALILSVLGWQNVSNAYECNSGSTCVIGSGGGQENSMTRETAQQSKEQWNDTRSLRKKIDRRAEKQFDKVDTAIDAREACDESSNINAYWEPDTRRCLDRNTGRPIAP